MSEILGRWPEDLVLLLCWSRGKCAAESHATSWRSPRDNMNAASALLPATSIAIRQEVLQKPCNNCRADAVPNQRVLLASLNGAGEAEACWEAVQICNLLGCKESQPKVCEPGFDLQVGESCQLLLGRLINTSRLLTCLQTVQCSMSCISHKQVSIPSEAK